jgi:hypothetical protein
MFLKPVLQFLRVLTQGNNVSPLKMTKRTRKKTREVDSRRIKYKTFVPVLWL